MGKTVAETIKEITKNHLEKGGLLLSQCVTAVGWINNTVPEMDKGIVELPVSDVAGGAFSVGAALAGRRPIYIIRFQGFGWYNVISIVNYAAKSKDIWDVPCPVFVRSIGVEGSGIGPVASSCQHSLVMRMPGIKVCAPMTPNEWMNCWERFTIDDDPYYCSEHRRSFVNDFEMNDIIQDNAVLTIFAISAARLNACEAIKELNIAGIKCNLIHVVWLKPFVASNVAMESLKKTKLGLVLDSDFEICGASRSIAYELMLQTGYKVVAKGLKDKTCGITLMKENITPSTEQIIDQVKNMVRL